MFLFLFQTYAALSPFFPVIPTREQVQAFYNAVKVMQFKSHRIYIWVMYHGNFDKPVSLQPYKLDKASVLQLINLAPTSLVELFLVSNLSLPQTRKTLLAPAGYTHVSHTAHTMLVVIIISTHSDCRSSAPANLCGSMSAPMHNCALCCRLYQTANPA